MGVKRMYELHQLLSQLKDHEWVNLSHEVHEEIPFYHTFNPLKETVISSMDEDNVYSLEYTIGSSHGTHIDAPSHFAEGKRDYSDIPQEERALPLDVSYLENEVKEDPGYAITVDDIQNVGAKDGKMPADSFVAFSSCWYKRFYDSDVFKN